METLVINHNEVIEKLSETYTALTNHLDKRYKTIENKIGTLGQEVTTLQGKVPDIQKQIADLGEELKGYFETINKQLQASQQNKQTDE